MQQRIVEILLCANFHWPRLQTVACIHGTKKALKIGTSLPTNTQNMSERHMQYRETKYNNKQSWGHATFRFSKINYKKTIGPIEMKLAGIVDLIEVLQMHNERYRFAPMGGGGRPLNVRFWEIFLPKIQYRSKTYATS